MNKTESAYAEQLELRKRLGEIAWYGYEAWKFRLADKTFYTPDFIVMLADGSIEAHEVKGTTRKNETARPYMMDDAGVKIKVAAEIHPIRFLIAFYDKHFGWRVEDK